MPLELMKMVCIWIGSSSGVTVEDSESGEDEEEEDCSDNDSIQRTEEILSVNSSRDYQCLKTFREILYQF